MTDNIEQTSKVVENLYFAGGGIMSLLKFKDKKFEKIIESMVDYLASMLEEYPESTY